MLGDYRGPPELYRGASHRHRPYGYPPDPFEEEVNHHQRLGSHYEREWQIASDPYRRPDDWGMEPEPWGQKPWRDEERMDYDGVTPWEEDRVMLGNYRGLPARHTDYDRRDYNYDLDFGPKDSYGPPRDRHYEPPPVRMMPESSNRPPSLLDNFPTPRAPPKPYGAPPPSRPALLEQLKDFFGSEPPSDIWRALNDQAIDTRRKENRTLLGITPMQNQFSDYLLSFGAEDDNERRKVGAIMTRERDRPGLLELGKELNDQHPAYDRNKLEEFQKIDGPDVFLPIFDSPYSLAIFDKAYENSIWDYDPKFTWDYLPTTKRGSKPAELRFLFNKDYIAEEFAWKKWEKQVETVWRTSFVPKVLKQQEMVQKGIHVKTTGEMTVEELPENRVLKYFDENVGFPDDFCSVEYCSVCDSAFTTVIPSITHYFSDRHETKVKKFFINSLLEHNKAQDEDIERQWCVNLIRRLTKKYKTRPTEWFCSVCSVVISSLIQAKSHFKGVQHQRKSKGLPMIQKVKGQQKRELETQCAPCGVTFKDKADAAKHIHSRRHVLNVQALAASNIVLPPGPSSRIGSGAKTKKMYAKAAAFASGSNMEPLGAGTPGVVPSTPGMSVVQVHHLSHTCATCHKSFTQKQQYDAHLSSSEHLMRESAMATRALKGKAPVLPMGAVPTVPRQQKQIAQGTTVGSLGYIPGTAKQSQKKNNAQSFVGGYVGFMGASTPSQSFSQQAVPQQTVKSVGKGTWVKASNLSSAQNVLGTSQRRT